MRRFLKRHVAEIRESGWRAVARKIRTCLRLIVQSPLILPALVCLIIVRVVRPLVHFRFGPLHSSLIGHFVGFTEIYLCEKDAGLHDSRAIDIFFYRYSIANHQLKRMWNRILHVWSFARWLDWFNRRLPGGQKHIIPVPMNWDEHFLLAGTKSHLSFTVEEERLGQRALKALGIPEGAPFISFHARDKAYKNSVHPEINWSYHNYRNSSIDNYIPAVEQCVRRGYYAVRVGSVVSGPLKTVHPKIIDYSMNGRSDFLDIYLNAKCRFYIGDTSGITTVSLVFRCPRVYVNRVPLERPFIVGTNDLFIPKKLWLRKERRFMSFAEIVRKDARKWMWTAYYDEHGVEAVENTPEEITALTLEMDERLKGTWQTTPEDEMLQTRFWSVFDPPRLDGPSYTRIGAEFLRKNRELLD